MTTTIAQKSTGPKFNKGDGPAYVYTDKVAAVANPAVNDVYKYLIPAGVEVTSVAVQPADLDTNGSPTIAFKVGYEAVDPASALAAVTNYFAATGQTTAQTGGRLVCAFVPIVFNEDIYVTVTFTATAATFAAGDVWTLVSANTIGIK